MFPKDKSSYAAYLILNNNARINAKLDSGSPVSLISLDTIDQLFGFNVSVGHDSETDEVFTDLTHNKILMRRYFVRNVLLGNIFIPEFRFYTPVENNVRKVSDLVGFDFIQACELYLPVGGDFQIKRFDYEVYTRYWATLGPCEEICEVK